MQGGRENIRLSRVKVKQNTIENKSIFQTSIEQKKTNLKVGKDPTYTQLAFEQTRKSRLKMFLKDLREENIPEIKQDKKKL